MYDEWTKHHIGYTVNLEIVYQIACYYSYNMHIKYFYQNILNRRAVWKYFNARLWTLTRYVSKTHINVCHGSNRIFIQDMFMFGRKLDRENLFIFLLLLSNVNIKRLIIFSPQP